MRPSGLVAWRRFVVSQLAAQKGESFVRAYGQNLAHRLPLFYCVVLVDIVALALRFRGTAPSLLSVWAPGVFFGIVASRGLYWLPQVVAARSAPEIERALKRMNLIGPLLGGSLGLWSLALYAYGDLAQQSLVHYITAITCFTGILALGHAPLTALRMAGVVIVPATVVFLANDHPNGVAISAVQIAVAGLLLVMTAGYHRDFVDLELSRQRLAQREREAARLAEANRQHAVVDPLTGAANRRAILAAISAALAGQAAPSPWLALVDLDGFKHVNDTYGHAAGDAVLCAATARIAGIPEIAAFGRLGGDEFALLLSGELSPAAVREVLEGLAGSIREPIFHGSETLRVSCSIGLRRTVHGARVGECLERTDTALYKAKQFHRGSVALFTEADEQAMQERRAITRVFHSADLESQIGLVYQPIVDVDAGRTVGFEALARWSPDGQTWLLPGKFVDVAEATGRIADLTRTVLRKALAECRAWERGCSLSINLSARDILLDDAAERIAREVRAADAPPAAIVLEITETALLSDYRRAAATLHQLRGLGFRIALDDFGTGQSSLSHVHQLPLDHIKIDHSFARNLASDAGARAITGTILALARQLRLECTVEGIETAEQQAAARRLGLRLMQGWLFGRPLPVDQALAALDRAA